MRERFDEEFRALLDEDNPDTRSIWSYVTRLIRQYCLDGYGTTAHEILAEVYCRGIKRITEQKQPIENPLGWIRLTAHNVVRENSRRRQRWASFEETVAGIEFEIIPTETSVILVGGEDIEENIQALYTAFGQLTLKEQELLCLRIIHGLSWQEVGKNLTSGNKKASEVTVRQQGYRALVRLRKLFHALKSQDPGDQAA